MIINIIGKKPKDGTAIELNKWFVGMDIRKCPPGQIGIFRPSIFLWCVKFKYNETASYETRRDPKNTIGGFKSFISPIGIVFRIEKY